MVFSWTEEQELEDIDSIEGSIGCLKRGGKGDQKGGWKKGRGKGGEEGRKKGEGKGWK